MTRSDDSRREETYVGQLPRPPASPQSSTDEIPAVGVPHLIVFRVTPGGLRSEGLSYPVRGTVVIGRSEDASIVLVSDDVSRHHAEVAVTPDGEHAVTDLDSANGTLVNDQEVKQALLHPGDRITIGSSFCLLFTRYHPLETQLRQAQKLESLGQLAAGISHEINNPLAFVYYNLESLTRAMSRVGSVMVDTLSAMLQLRQQLGPRLASEGLSEIVSAVEAAADPEGLEGAAAALADAKDGVQRILTIVRDLKTFSRIEEDTLAAVNVNDVVEVAAKIACHEIKFRARLVKDFGPAPLTMANEGRLAQVFLNLLMNAAQACAGDPEENTVSLRTRLDAGHVVVEVRDTGRGIPAEDLDHLFEPFFTTKRGGFGSGLGLSICHNIVTAHGGTIEVTSTEGSGSCFRVRLPRLQTDTTARPTIEHPPLRPRGEAREAQILVIDDEVHMGTAIQRTLLDHRVEAVSSGAAAAQRLLSDRSFDLVLCDLQMPVTSGMDLYRLIEQQRPELLDRVVFMSGGAFTPEALEFLRRVPIRVLDKPIALEMLEELIQEMLHRRDGS